MGKWYEGKGLAELVRVVDVPDQVRECLEPGEDLGGVNVLEFQQFLDLTGYYKLSEPGRETQYKNYVSPPPSGTEKGVKTGMRVFPYCSEQK